MAFERKNFEEFKQKIDNAPKMEIDLSFGLNDEQIQSRVNDGLTNKTPKRSSKTIKDIIKDNLLSFFNILLFVIGIVYIYVDVVPAAPAYSFLWYIFLYGRRIFPPSSSLYFLQLQ